MHPGGRDLPVEHADRPADRRRVRDGAEPGQDGQQRPRASAGISSRNRWIGSCTRVPASARACRSTSGVRLRKSPAVLDMVLSKVAWAWLCRGAVAGVGQGDGAVDDLPAVAARTAAPRTRSPRPRGRRRAAWCPAPHRPARTRRRCRSVRARSAVRRRPAAGWSRRRCSSSPGRCRSAARCRSWWSPGSVTAIPNSVGQGGLDHLLLHLPVQRHRDLLGGRVLPEVDQRILLGELAERGVQVRRDPGRAPAVTTVSRVGGANQWVSGA